MPVEFVGGLFARNQLAPRGAIAARPDLNYLRDLARAHEHAGFDRVLIANGGADPLILAAHAAAHTERLGFMLAHRPGLVSPAVAARAFATLDHTTGGRVRLHTVTGHAAEPEHGDTLTDKNDRYAQASEYLDIVRRAWTEDAPFDYEGRFYNLRGVHVPLKPLQKPHVPVSLGGSSDAAYHVAVKHADLYALWAEPLVDTKARIDKLNSIAKAAGVQAPRVSLSVRLIIGPTEEIAWQRAREIAATLKRNHEASTPRIDRGHSGGALRQVEVAGRGEVHDRALYFGTSSAIGFGTDSTSLVGTPDTLIQSLLDYYDIGVTTFLSRGYDPLYDAIDYGRYIFTPLREEIARRDAEVARKQANAA
jgi:alkanesulfonate monooxygenase